MNKCSSTAARIKRVGKLVKAREYLSGAAQQSLSVSVIGLDVGDRKSNFCALDDNGEIIGEGQISTTFDGQRQYFAGMRPTRVALESGAHSAWMSRLIASLGHEVIVANAKELRKIHQSDRKNDRADARILARLARFDPELLAPIAHRSAEMQADLSLLRARETLVSARTKCINAARGLVKTTGTRLPQCSTRSFARQCFAHVPPELEAALGPLLATIDAICGQIHEYDKQIDKLIKERYPITELLQQVTGVGSESVKTVGTGSHLIGVSIYAAVSS